MMHDVQPGSEQAPETPDTPERDIEAERAADPKPVYPGDWQSATGVQKGQHSERVRQWRRRELERDAAEAAERIGAGSQQPVGHDHRATPPSGLPPDPTRAVLEAIRDNPGAHDSDRIRAAQQLIALDRVDGAEAGSGSGLAELRTVLELLTPDERLAWLQGERLEHAGIGRSG
jgi:hypothetical protein